MCSVRQGFEVEVGEGGITGSGHFAPLRQCCFCFPNKMFFFLLLFYSKTLLKRNSKVFFSLTAGEELL